VVGDADEGMVIRDHRPEIFAADVDADRDVDAERVVVAGEKVDANHEMIDHAEVETEEAETAADKVADVEVVVKEGEVKEEVLMEIFLRYRNPPEVTKTP